ncbi:LppX_LprAFG lipoprotein [Amycolatopsis sp. K13G38]|uniref:LppX_LprAFG lipoprotein n=1 Tax=Amycolatopsis acididurans TaxID=2724524 RepID=A0ABX1JC84_9PSEU|nr:LppX_LprAFG lipoprotein [Amycolatopsis acididurans]NKQ57403.1 LppX_LprAFG lipoprotein [Amycolatopsis acididurans]
MLRRRTAGVLVMVLALASGCSASPDTRGPLPDASSLVTAAAATFGQLRSFAFDFTVSGSVPGLNVREVKGVASKDGGPYGSASGQADMQESQNRFEVTYSINGDKLVLTGKNGIRDEQPVPVPYNPVALFDPAHGLPKLLTAATGVKTETREDLKGVQTYRVTGEIAEDVVQGVLPTVASDVDVKFWVTQSEPRNLVRVWMQVPPRQPNEGAVMLELGLTQPSATTPAG